MPQATCFRGGINQTNCPSNLFHQIAATCRFPAAKLAIICDIKAMPDSAKTTVALYHGRSVFVTNGFYGFDGLAPGAFQTGGECLHRQHRQVFLQLGKQLRIRAAHLECRVYAVCPHCIRFGFRVYFRQTEVEEIGAYGITPVLLISEDLQQHPLPGWVGFSQQHVDYFILQRLEPFGIGFNEMSDSPECVDACLAVA